VRLAAIGKRARLYQIVVLNKLAQILDSLTDAGLEGPCSAAAASVTASAFSREALAIP